MKTIITKVRSMTSFGKRFDSFYTAIQNDKLYQQTKRDKRTVRQMEPEEREEFEKERRLNPQEFEF
jgi:hypothetical protein